MRVSTTVLQNSFGKYLKQAIEGTPVYIEKNSEPVAVLKAVTEEERWASQGDVTSIHGTTQIYLRGIQRDC